MKHEVLALHAIVHVLYFQLEQTFFVFLIIQYLKLQTIDHQPFFNHLHLFHMLSMTNFFQICLNVNVATRAHKGVNLWQYAVGSLTVENTSYCFRLGQRSDFHLFVTWGLYYAKRILYAVSSDEISTAQRHFDSAVSCIQLLARHQ